MKYSSLKWLVLASIINLVGNSLGIILAVKNNLIADLGGTLHGQDASRDFISTGTALSAPLQFMLIQLAFTVLTLASGWLRKIGIVGLTFFGLIYTPAQLGERIILRLLRPGGFNLAQFTVYVVNVITAIAMLVFGIWAWKTERKFKPVA
jgi:hypothetical protein